MMNNPWQVESMEEFVCLKCPECIFTTKEENVFQDHAVETHPLSHVLYGIPKTDSDANIVVHDYDPNDIIKDYTKENVNVQYSSSNSNEVVSMITEDISEKTYCVEVSFDKSCTDGTELDFNSYVTNLDKELTFEEKTPFAPFKVGKEIHNNDQNCIDDYPPIFFSTPSNALKDVTGNFVNTVESNSDQTLFDKQEFEKSHIAVVHEGKKPFKCPICNARFSQLGSLNGHVARFHEKKKPNEFCIEASKFVKDMMCLICDLEFDTLVASINHIKKEHNIVDKVIVIKEKPSDIDQNCIEDYQDYPHKKPLNFLKNIAGKFANKVETNNDQTMFDKQEFKENQDSLKKGLPCSICNVSFRDQNNLKMHLTRFHGKNKFKCLYCKDRFSRNDHLKHHMKFKCKEKIYVKFEDWQIDKMIEELRDGFESWRMIADISPSNTAPMKEERFEKFRKWINVLKPPEGKKLTQFATFQILRKRIYNWIKKCKNRQKQISASETPLAKWQGSWKTLYDLIIMNKLPDESTSNKVLETLPVEKERKILNDSGKSTKKIHEKSKLNSKMPVFAKSITCSQIEKKTKELPWCHICNINFNLEQKLKDHFKSAHTEEKPYKCFICCISFTLKDGLKNHLRDVHEGNKPLPSQQCPFCDKKLFRKDKLNDHISSVHEKEKLNQCDTCKCFFSNKQHLKRHIETVHEKKKPFKCSTCEKCFSQTHVLNRHIKTVHEGILFECSICVARFSRKDKLKKHMDERHKNPLEN